MSDPHDYANDDTPELIKCLQVGAGVAQRSGMLEYPEVMLVAAQRLEAQHRALYQAREAIRLTREYVDPGCYGPQPSLLPPMEGWSWFDAVVMIDEILGDTSEWAHPDEALVEFVKNQLGVELQPWQERVIGEVSFKHYALRLEADAWIKAFGDATPPPEIADAVKELRGER